MNPRFSIVLRTAQGAALGPTARQVIREIDPSLPVQIRTVDDALNRAVAGRRFSLTLIAVFSGAALVLATLGIYGLISYLVAERTREIGIRLALGAASADVLRMVLGKGALLAGVGMAVGLLASLGLTGFLKGMLFGVTATDPIAFASVIVVTMTAVLGASYLPARRALKVAPVTALRGSGRGSTRFNGRSSASRNVQPRERRSCLERALTQFTSGRPRVYSSHGGALLSLLPVLPRRFRALASPCRTRSPGTRIGDEAGGAGHRQHVAVRAVVGNAVFGGLAPAARLEALGRGRIHDGLGRRGPGCQANRGY